VIIAGALILLGATALILPKVGSEFMPGTETPGFSVEIKMPEGTRLERTAETTGRIENIISELLGDKIRLIYSHAGITTTTGSDESDLFRDENTSLIKVFLFEEYVHMADDAILLIENNIGSIPDIEITFTREESTLSSTIGTDEAPFVVEIRGEELETIEAITTDVKNILLNNQHLHTITTSLDEGTPEVDVVIDRFRASYYVVTVESIVSQIQSFLEGSEAGEFEDGGEIKDITVKLQEVPLADLQDLIINAGSVSVPLSELAQINIEKSPKEITRNNQVRTSYVYAMVNDNAAFDMVAREVAASLDDMTLPVDYRTVITGQELKRKESLSNLSFALVLSIILVYMVLASQFESLLHPFVIILTIPLAVVGSIWTFYAIGIPLNMMAYIGIIMLVGIAVNDSIILIDRINQLKEDGMSRYDAIIAAGAQRIRPILMTSITTILALLPLTFGFGESASLRSPMALAVIGGLVTSTILTLVVIPTVYWALDSVKDYLRKENKTL